MSLLRSNVLAAKARLAKGNEDFKAPASGRLLRASSSAPGQQSPRRRARWNWSTTALADLGEAGPKGLLDDIALVAHGGYGRRDVAPYSDVDLMILHRRGAAARLVPPGRAAVPRRVRRGAGPGA